MLKKYVIQSLSIGFKNNDLLGILQQLLYTFPRTIIVTQQLFSDGKEQSITTIIISASSIQIYERGELTYHQHCTSDNSIR